ncbi:MAG: hypothetical protein EPN82_11715 [Bacteroidetes bacterium]|nr:MAG: hypothetical protein EPN82_11715 [Bacteroidota bacterium]
MKRIAVSLTFIAILIVSHLQVYSQETQVAIDNDNKLYLIDSEMESKLLLFKEYPGFIDARLYQISDENFVLEISYKVDERTMRQRKNMNTNQVKELRNQVSQCIQEKCPVILINQEGRSTFLAGTTMLGLGAWDWMVPSMLDVEDNSTYMALYLSTAALSFFVPYLITENSPVTEGAASLSIFGGALGIAHGLMLNYLFSDDFTSGSYGLMFSMSIAELIGGYYLATNTNMTEGKASVLSTMTAIGIGYGIGLPFIFGAEEKESYMLGGLLGSGVGYFAGNLISNSQNYTVGDASILANCGMLGAYLPLMINAIAETKDGESVVATVLLGAASGIFIGDRLVLGKDFTKSQGTFISIGTLAGGLLGGSIGFLFEGNDLNSDGKMVMLFSALGAIGGFTVMYESFKDKARVPENRTSLEFEFNPGSYAVSKLYNNSKSLYQPYIPMVGLKYRF